MKKRDKHLKIIAAFPHESYHRARMIAVNGYSIFTDEAVRALAHSMVRAHRQAQKMNAANREARR